MRRSTMHLYKIRFLTKDRYNKTEIEAEDLESAIEQLVSEAPDIAQDNIIEIISIYDNGKRLKKNQIDNLNSEFFGEDLDECDAGGAAAGGDAGGAVGGDASSASGAADAGGAVGDSIGTTSGEVLGNCDHNDNFDGFFGKGCFHIPSRVRTPFHRWEIANGGSRRKKDKNGKPKKTPYEKGMKVVVDMFESDIDQQLDSSSKKKIKGRLKALASNIKNIRDVKAVEAKFQRDGNKAADRISKSGFGELKNLFIDMGRFLKAICTGEYRASWFTVTMIAVGVAYILLPTDLIPDMIPVVGQLDDVFVLNLIYRAIRDEFEEWRSSNAKLTKKSNSQTSLDDFYEKTS